MKSKADGVRQCVSRVGGGGGAGGVTTDESFLLKTFRPHPHEIDVLVKQVGLYVLSA